MNSCPMCVQAYEALPWHLLSEPAQMAEGLSATEVWYSQGSSLQGCRPFEGEEG